MADTNLAQSIEAADAESRYDTNVKHILADKQVLARILKYAVSEFSGMSIDEIMSCIGNDIEIGTRPIDAGLTNLGRISGTNTEDNIPNEGKIFFDIRFSAYKRDAELKILINVEAQRSTDPKALGYHLENRIVFYIARMVSAQKHTEFSESNYDDLKKVRSIWICMDNKDDGDAIEEIALTRKTVFGKTESKADIDLIKGIIINIRTGDNVEESKNELIAMLEKLLSDADVEEKKRVLEEKYNMVMSVDMEGRVSSMCNLSQVVKEKGIKQGLEQGMVQGLERGVVQGLERGLKQGAEQERVNAIRRMLQADITIAQIIACGYTDEEISKAEGE